MGTEVISTTEETNKAEAPSVLELKIIRQVEYYFGNYNLCKDKFLREQIKLDEGWIPLETLVKFNRLKSLSEDHTIICNALKKSSHDLLEINEDHSKIRRRVEKPVPDVSYLNQAVVEDRTLYVKGFKKSTTLDELLDFFKEHKAEHIFMRRLKNAPRAFKGSCYILFETVEDADKFLENTGIKYEGTELLKEKKKDYTKRKDEFYDNLRAEKEKKSLNKKEENPKEGGEVAEVDMIPGCLLKITGLGENIIREDIKEALGDNADAVAYIDYNRGRSEGVVRFETGVAADVYEKAEEEDGKKTLDVKFCKGVLSLFEDEEEKEYWRNIARSRANTKLKHSQFQRHGRGGRFQNNRGKRSRGGRREDGQPSKRVKTEVDNEKDGSSATTTKTEVFEEKDHQSQKDGPPLKKMKTELTDEKHQLNVKGVKMEHSNNQEDKGTVVKVE